MATPTTSPSAPPGTASAPEAGMRQLLAQLSGQRVIAYNVNLARLCGDVKATLFASQLLYWSRVGQDLHTNGGWIFKTREQWQTETGLTRFEQESARKRLQSLSLIEQARVGAPPSSCFRIDLPVLGKSLAKLLNQPPPSQQWSLFVLRSSEAQIRQLLGRNMAYYTVFAKVTQSIPAAVLLTKVLALHSVVTQRASPSAKGQKDADWFSLTGQQWQDETGLRAAQLRSAKQELCQLEILEEALQTYPLRRTYHRVNIVRVSRLLAQQLTPSQSTLLGRIVAHARAQEVADGTVEAGVPNRDTVSSGYGVKKFNSVSRGHSVKQFNSLFPSISTKPASYPVSANQEGGFSHVNRLVLAHQTATFSRTRGEFSQDTRLVLAPLHVRAVKEITDLTTTTTTPAVSPVGVVGLVWPSGLMDVQSKAQALLSRLPPTDRQSLLDEMAGQMTDGKVRFALAYLRKLIDLHLSGALILERADDVALARQRQADAAARLQSAISGGRLSSPNSFPAGKPDLATEPHNGAVLEAALQARAKAKALLAEWKPNRFGSPDSSRNLRNLSH